MTMMDRGMEALGTLFAPRDLLDEGRGFPTDLPTDSIAGINKTRFGLPDSDAFGRDQFSPKRWQRLNLLLDSARTEVRFRIAGTVIWCPDSTMSTDLVQVRLDGQENDQIPFKPGTKVAGSLFQEFYISNLAHVAGRTLVLIITNDTPADRVAVES